MVLNSHVSKNNFYLSKLSMTVAPESKDLSVWGEHQGVMKSGWQLDYLHSTGQADFGGRKRSLREKINWLVIVDKIIFSQAEAKHLWVST